MSGPAAPARGAGLDDTALDILFRQAHTANAFTAQAVSDEDLRRIFDLMKMAPTSANCQPGRFVFVRSAAAKQRLEPALSAGNRAKTMAAPLTVIVAHDLRFHEHLPRVFPHDPGAVGWFDGEARRPVRELTAFRNGTLQGAYFILAARALGFDCGPMSGFDNAKVDAEFFPGGRCASNFLINLGHADPAGFMPRNPRLDFEDACRIL